MPRATRWLLLGPLLLCFAGLFAAQSPRAMVNLAVPTFTYEHADAYGMSCDRDRTGESDARRRHAGLEAVGASSCYAAAAG